MVLVLSDAYLRSEYCMTELYRIYTNAWQRGDELLRRILPLVQPDAGIDSIGERIAHSVYWKTQYEKLSALLREHGPDVIGVGDFAKYKLIGELYLHVGEILGLVNDKLLAQDRATLSRDGVASVKGLIDRAPA